MHTGRNRGLVRHGLAALTFTLALAGTRIAGATTASTSASGTTIPSVSQIVDSGHNIWTVAGGVIYENGKAAGYSANVVLLLFSSGTVYQENKSCRWWAWNGSTWVATNNPSPTTMSACSNASANDTMIPSASQIVDGAGNVWTVAGGVVYENGKAAGYSANVIRLLYSGATVYQQNKLCLWWSWNGSKWLATTNPAPGVTPACPATPAASSPVASATGSPKPVPTPASTPASTPAPAPAPTPAPAPAPAPTPASSSTVTPSGNFGIQVKGNHFVSSLDGSVLHLVGSNVSGLEGGAGNSPRVWGGFSGTSVAQWKTIASTWGINIIRLPINSYDWLNIVCVDPGSGNAASSYSSNGNGTYTPDPKGIFHGIVAQTVANLTAAGLYVILDLHWDAPNNAAGQPQCPVGQPAFAGSDHALDFWSSIATTFQGNPAVMFELFNEPFGDGVYGDSVNNVAPGPDALLMRDGGLLAPFHMQNNPAGNTDLILNHGGQAPVAGKQAMINAIRATGATNVILDSPIWWAGEIETWLAAKPTDPLGQLAVAWHIYGYNKGPAPALNVLAKGYPIMITENEGFDAALDGGRSSNGYAWAAANDIGCLQWGWNNWGGASNLQALVSTNPWSAGGAPLP